MDQPRSFDTRDFRNTLGSFATGVTIITTRGADGVPVGITVNSFNSVSLEPPMVLWSLARTSRSLAAFEEAEHWAVHILSAEQEGLSTRFARSGEDKFSGVAVERGVGEVPLLGGCTARLQCRTSIRHDGGDHIIFIGEVLAYDRSDVAPLVFHGGKYAVAARKTDSSLPSGAPVPDPESSFGEDFLAYLLSRAHFQLYARARTHLHAADLSDVEWFVLSSLTAKNGRGIDELHRMYAITGGNITAQTLQGLSLRNLVTLSGTSVEATAAITPTGRELALRVLAALKSMESELVAGLGHHESVALKNLLRQLIQRTDPGLPDMWGRQ
jgi:3-hydroxy-9,10-secoandrosta-1,3,5(10)-triene-9,17-dione monooxygenase reductase component